MTNTPTKDAISDEALNAVVGGLNPQPLPPGPDSFRISHFAANQHFALPSFSFLKFR